MKKKLREPLILRFGMIKMIEKLIKIAAIFMAICSIIAIGLMFLISHILSKDKDLVKNGTLKSAIIEQNNLIFALQEGYTSGLEINHNNQTVYSQSLGRKVSKLTIENYPSIIQNKQIYNFMLYQYELGGHGFSGFDFCINNKTVFYGKDIKNCLKDDGLD